MPPVEACYTLRRVWLNEADVDGYYQPMLRFLENMSAEGFLADDFREMLIVTADVAEALERFSGYRPPRNKWA